MEEDPKVLLTRFSWSNEAEKGVDGRLWCLSLKTGWMVISWSFSFKCFLIILTFELKYHIWDLVMPTLDMSNVYKSS